MKVCFASWIFLVGLALSCATYKTKPPEQVLQTALADLQPWQELWAPRGLPAEDEAYERAAMALKKLEFLEDEEPASINLELVSLGIGEALFATGDFAGAKSRFTQHLENYPLTAIRGKIEKYLFQLALYWARSDGSFLYTGLFPDSGKAIRTLEYLVNNAPHSPYADDALRLIGDIYLADQEYDDARTNFERILTAYPDSEWVDLALYRIAECFLRRVKGPAADRDGLLQAKTRLESYLVKRTEGAWRKEAEIALQETNEKLAESEYLIGKFYQRIGQPYGASYHFAKTVEDFPNTAYGQLAKTHLQE